MKHTTGKREREMNIFRFRARKNYRSTGLSSPLHSETMSRIAIDTEREEREEI